jgi:hypothetical protein
VSRTAAKVLLAASAWTLYVWTTRIWNILNDDHSVGFKVVHAVLAVVSIGFAIAIGIIGWRGLRSRPSDGDESAGNDGLARTAVEQRP